MKTYLLDYQLFFLNKLVKQGTYKVRNCSGEFGAKIKLETFLKKIYTFDNIVIDKCAESNLVTDLFATFN